MCVIVSGRRHFFCAQLFIFFFFFRFDMQSAHTLQTSSITPHTYVGSALMCPRNVVFGTKHELKKLGKLLTGCLMIIYFE